MKKLNLRFITILCFLLLNIGLVSSQIRFGLRGGFDVTDNRVNENIFNINNRLGYRVGGVVEVMAPVIGWGGEVAVLYGQQRFKVTDGEYNLSDYNYLRVPLSLKKRFSIVGLFRVFFVLGPYAEFKLSGGDLYRTENLIEQYKSKSFGMGYDAGGGFELLKHLEIGMYYRKSLTDNFSADTLNINDILRKRPSNWAVDLTYYF